MTTQVKNTKLSLDKIASTKNINEIIFMGLVVLCFMGDVMGEVSDHAVVIYWLLMTPIFFLGSMIIEKAQEKKSSSSLNIQFSLIIWSSAFFSVLIVLFLWHAESLAVPTVGLIIHVILGHTLFVSGIILGFRFYLIGLFLLLLAWFTIAMEGVVGMALVFAIPVVLVGLHYKNKFLMSLKSPELHN